MEKLIDEVLITYIKYKILLKDQAFEKTKSASLLRLNFLNQVIRLFGYEKFVHFLLKFQKILEDQSCSIEVMQQES